MYVCVPRRLKANFIIFPTMFGAVLGFEINNIESVIIRQGRLLNFLIFLTVFAINLFNGYNSSKLLLYEGPTINLQINTLTAYLKESARAYSTCSQLTA